MISWIVRLIAKRRPGVSIHVPGTRWSYITWEPDTLVVISGETYWRMGGYSQCWLPHAIDDPDQPKFLLAPIIADTRKPPT